MNQKTKAQLTAELLVDSCWTGPEFWRRLDECRGKKSSNVQSLVQRLIARFPQSVSLSRLFDYLLKNEANELRSLSLKRLQQACAAAKVQPSPMRTGIEPASRWLIPSIESISRLANLLQVSVRELDWLAAAHVGHYGVKGLRKKAGGVRIVEIPKPRLKKIQRRILREILNWIPPHLAAHGFVSPRSAISYVQPHIDQYFVIRMDLQDFFPSIDANRVWGLFRSLGYPYPVVQRLTGLCTCCSQPSQLYQASSQLANLREQHRLVSMYHRRHLPQGAPTSPQLANLMAYRMDCRLAGLADATDVKYTRYADDLLFSGGERLAKSGKSFSSLVGGIALEEGFQLQYRKTRHLRKSQRQSAAGIVINRVPNLRRSDYDKLKAILHNCVRLGGASQNRQNHPNFREHLLGRIDWVGQLNSRRGEKLRLIFDRIAWE